MEPLNGLACHGKENLPPPPFLRSVSAPWNKTSKGKNVRVSFKLCVWARISRLYWVLEQHPALIKWAIVENWKTSMPLHDITGIAHWYPPRMTSGLDLTTRSLRTTKRNKERMRKAEMIRRKENINASSRFFFPAYHFVMTLGALIESFRRISWTASSLFMGRSLLSSVLFFRRTSAICLLKMKPSEIGLKNLLPSCFLIHRINIQMICIDNFTK